MGEAEDAVRAHVRKGIDELEALRDAVKDKNGEASREAKDAWQKLEPQVAQRIAELEQTARGVTSVVVGTLDSTITRAVEDVKSALAELKKKL